MDELTPIYEDLQITSASGTLDDETYPITLENVGSVRDTFTLTFTGASNFTCSGALEGSIGTGSVGADFAPYNADTGTPYFTIPASAFGGTFASGDTITFTTSPAAIPVWLREHVPAGTNPESMNFFYLQAYFE